MQPPVPPPAKQLRVVLCVTNNLAADQRLHKTAVSLQQLGYEVAFLGRGPRRQTPRNRPYAIRLLPVWPTRGPGMYAVYNLKLFWALLWVRADAITANDLDTLLGAALAARLRRKPLVLDAHELFTEIPEVVARPRVQRVWRWLEARLMPRVNAMSTVSEAFADIFQRRYGRRPVVVANLPMARPRPDAAGPKENIVVYQGMLKAGRGIELMIESLQFAQHYRLWLVGTGKLEPHFRELANRLGVSDKLQFWGFVPFEDLPAITRQAKLGLSLEDPGPGNTRFSAPNKLFDCIQDGVPVVTSDLPVHRRIVEEYGVGAVLTERSPQALACLLDDLCSHEARYAKLVGNIPRAASALTWEANLPTLKALYSSVLPQHE